MFHVEIGVKLVTRPLRSGTIRVVPTHPGYDFNGSLRSIVLMHTEFPGEFGFNQDLWDAVMSLPHALPRPNTEPWRQYAERFAERMTQKKWNEELRGATSSELSIVIPKNVTGGNF